MTLGRQHWAQQLRDSFPHPMDIPVVECLPWGCGMDRFATLAESQRSSRETVTKSEHRELRERTPRANWAPSANGSCLALTSPISQMRTPRLRGSASCPGLLGSQQAEESLGQGGAGDPRLLGGSVPGACLWLGALTGALAHSPEASQPQGPIPGSCIIPPCSLENLNSKDLQKQICGWACGVPTEREAEHNWPGLGGSMTIPGFLQTGSITPSSGRRERSSEPAAGARASQNPRPEARPALLPRSKTPVDRERGLPRLWH